MKAERLIGPKGKSTVGRKERWLRLLALLSLAIPSTIVSPSSSSDAAVGPGTSGRIVFSRDGSLFVIDADGTGERQLTSRGRDNHPAWSPDGARIAFIRLVGKTHMPALFVMEADGSAIRRVSGELRGYAQPASWSPDGRRLVFEDFIESNPNRGAIETVRPDGTGLRRLTGFAYRNGHPSWSPDGERIAFITNRDGDPEIFVMNRNGTEKRQMTDNAVLDEGPSWSTDGTQVAYSTDSQQREQIAVLSIDEGSQPTVLSDGTRDDASPRWFQDRIVFMGITTQGEEISRDAFVMAGDGSDLTNLTASLDRWIDHAVGAPDGSAIAVAYEGGISLASPDGSELVPLLDFEGASYIFGMDWWQPTQP